MITKEKGVHVRMTREERATVEEMARARHCSLSQVLIQALYAMRDQDRQDAAQEAAHQRLNSQGAEVEA